MKTAAKKTPAVTEETWKKLHAAYIEPPPFCQDTPTLAELAKRFGVPLKEAQAVAWHAEWEAERDAVEARAFFESTAPGITTEIAYCLDYASKMARVLGSDLGAIGGARSLEGQIADARVIWRKRMSKILIWEAIQASPKFGAHPCPPAV